MMGNIIPRAPTVHQGDSTSRTTIPDDSDSVMPQSSTESEVPTRIEILMRTKYDIIKKELSLMPQSLASRELANQRGLLQEELDFLLAQSSVNAKMELTTFTPWRYDIREHFEWTRPGTPSQFEKFQNSMGITKLDRGCDCQLKMIFVNCPTSNPSSSDFLRLLSSPLIDGFVDTESIDTAGQYGRICVVDFRSNLWEISAVNPALFIRTTIIGLLCSVFNGTIVDGIPFTLHEPEKFRDFNDWYCRATKLTVSGMVSEFRRLTRIGFRIHRTSPIVLILAGVDRVPDDAFLSIIQDDLETSPRPIILVCEGTNTRSLLERLRNTDRPMTSSSIKIVNDEAATHRKRKRKFARRIKPRHST